MKRRRTLSPGGDGTVPRAFRTFAPPENPSAIQKVINFPKFRPASANRFFPSERDTCTRAVDDNNYFNVKQRSVTRRATKFRIPKLVSNAPFSFSEFARLFIVVVVSRIRRQKRISIAAKSPTVFGMFCDVCV